MRFDDAIATKSVQITAHADGTRYRLVVSVDPEGGYLVAWPDAGLFGRGYEHDLAETWRGHVLRIYRWWGSKDAIRMTSGPDRANIELAVGAAVRRLEAL